MVQASSSGHLPGRIHGGAIESSPPANIANQAHRNSPGLSNPIRQGLANPFSINHFDNLAASPSRDFSGTRPSTTTAKMSTPQLSKIAANSPSHSKPSELEQAIAGALYDLESNTADLKAALRPLQFTSAREVRPH